MVNCSRFYESVIFNKKIYHWRTELLHNFICMEVFVNKLITKEEWNIIICPIKLQTNKKNLILFESDFVELKNILEINNISYKQLETNENREYLTHINRENYLNLNAHD